MTPQGFFLGQKLIQKKLYGSWILYTFLTILQEPLRHLRVSLQARSYAKEVIRWLGCACIFDYPPMSMAVHEV